MENNPSESTSSPHKKRNPAHDSVENIFKVRKVNQALTLDKYSKPEFSFKRELKNQSEAEHRPQLSYASKPQSKGADYHYHFLIISSPIYKELNHKFNQLRQEENRKKVERDQELSQRNAELTKYQTERQRLAVERKRLLDKERELRRRIDFLRNRRQSRHQEDQQQFSILPNTLLFHQSPLQDNQFSLENLRDMVMSMRYQNGIDINPDEMTYEQLLQLEEKMGSVSKGLTEAQIERLPKFEIQKLSSQQSAEDNLCSICYENAKQGEIMNRLPCSHSFHCDCVKEWLLKEKACPMCKQEIDAKLLNDQESQDHPFSDKHLKEESQNQCHSEFEEEELNDSFSNTENGNPSEKISEAPQHD